MHHAHVAWVSRWKASVVRGFYATVRDQAFACRGPNDLRRANPPGGALAVLMLVVAVGCGSAREAADASTDAPPDANRTEDAGAVEGDGGLDADGDGIARDRDCDDSNASVGSTATRAVSAARAGGA